MVAIESYALAVVAYIVATLFRLWRQYSVLASVRLGRPPLETAFGYGGALRRGRCAGLHGPNWPGSLGARPCQDGFASSDQARAVAAFGLRIPKAPPRP